MLPVALESVLWRADQMARPAGAVLESGCPTLDAALPGGGWPTQGLTELLCETPLSAVVRLLAPALARHTQKGGEVLLLAPPQPPLAAAWASWGVDASRLVWLQPGSAHDSAWALGECLRARVPLWLLAWLPEASPLTLRRLQVLAAGAVAPCTLVRPGALAASASPAPLRLRVWPEAGWRLGVQVLKRRGAPLAEPLWVDAAPPALSALWPQRHPVSVQVAPLGVETSDVVAGRTALDTERA